MLPIFGGGGMMPKPVGGGGILLIVGGGIGTPMSIGAYGLTSVGNCLI